jgi:hypothetical protein
VLLAAPVVAKVVGRDLILTFEGAGIVIVGWKRERKCWLAERGSRKVGKTLVASRLLLWRANCLVCSLLVVGLVVEADSFVGCNCSDLGIAERAEVRS